MTPPEAFESLSEDTQNQADYDRLQARTARFSNMRYPFVDVWDFKTALAFMVFSEDGKTSCVERITEADMEGLGITNKMLLDAIYSSGGGINRSGHYPITEEIKEKLAEGLKNVSLDQIQIQWKE
jgi:hypothetical protein